MDTGDLLLGALDEAVDSCENKETRLRTGDRIILYTDGIIERQTEAGEEFGHNRLLRAADDISILSLQAGRSA